MSRTQITSEHERSTNGSTLPFDRMVFLDDADHEVKKHGKAYMEALIRQAVQAVATEGRMSVGAGDIAQAAGATADQPQHASIRKPPIVRTAGLLLVGSASGPLWGLFRDEYQIAVAFFVFVVGLALALAPSWSQSRS